MQYVRFEKVKLAAAVFCRMSADAEYGLGNWSLKAEVGLYITTALTQHAVTISLNEVYVLKSFELRLTVKQPL